MKNIIVKLYGLGMVLVLLFMAYYFYLLNEPFKVPTVSPDPMPIINKDKIVRYGEPIQTAVESCTFRSVLTTVSVRYQLVDNTRRIFNFAPYNVKGKVGCRKSVLNREPIPPSLPTGKYKIYVTAVFHVNKLRDVTHVYETEEFELVGGDTK